MIEALPADTIEVSAPAKINLFLQVLGRRDDGYHELRSLMCCVGLHDTLVIQLGTDHNRLSCSNPDLPCDEKNLALKAGTKFNEVLATETGFAPKAFAIKLTKRIPVGAGLGGGSSDAAAVLRGLNDYYGVPLSAGTMNALALSLGADVPFFIEGKPAVATGIGERLDHDVQLQPWSVVLVYPGFGVSTAEVFKNLNLGLTKCEKQLRYFPFKYGKFDTCRHLCNDLETVAVQRFPVIETIKNALLAQGASGALMTGSGSAVFGLFTASEAAQKAGEILAGNAKWQVYVTELRV